MDSKCRGWVLLAVVLCSSCIHAQILPTFVDVSNEAGLSPEPRPKYFGPCIADLDRDGRYDLILTNHQQGVEWYWSSGSSRFQQDSSSVRSGDFHGISAGDLDGDSDLDVIITVGGSRGNYPNRPVVVEVLPERELNVTRGQGYGLARFGGRGRLTRFIDMDGDGDLDILYVNAQPRYNDSAPSHFVYENVAPGRYEYRPDVGFEYVLARWLTLIDVNGDGMMDIVFYLWDRVELWMWVAPFTYRDETFRIPNAEKLKHVRAGAEFDFDNDGDSDLYITRMLRTKLRKNRSQDVLFENVDGYFVEVSDEANIPDNTLHLHVSAGDFNNDGHLDLFLARHSDDGIRVPDLLLMNTGNKTFEHVVLSADLPWIPTETGDSGDALDYDMDGKLDVLVGSGNGPWRLFRNITPMENHYLIVRVGRPRNTLRDCSPMGAKVELHLGDMIISRRVGSAGESHSQSYMDTLHFGLGQRTIVYNITVTYSNGAQQKRVRSTPVDRVTTVGLFS